MSCSMQGPSGVGKRSQGRGTESWKFTQIHWKLSTFKTSWLLSNFQRRAGSANVRVCESQRFWRCCHLHWRARRRGLRPCAWLLFQVQYVVPEGGVPLWYNSVGKRKPGCAWQSIVKFIFIVIILLMMMFLIIITIISAVSSRRPIEIGSGGTREGERAAEVRAGWWYSHLWSLFTIFLAGFRFQCEDDDRSSIFV